MAVDKNIFSKQVGLIIDNLEGGYFHPNMLTDGRVNDSRYSTSGETMFGIDRLRGGSVNNTDAGREFWNIIDNSGAANKWPWNYKGGSDGPRLKALAADMMYPEYLSFEERYLSPEARKIVDKSAKLTFNFAYATWNGEGWFKNFASQINSAVADGITNPEKLAQIAVNARISPQGNWSSAAISLISEGGKKIASLFESAAFSSLDVIKKNKGKAIIALLALTVIVGGTLILYNPQKS